MTGREAVSWLFVPGGRRPWFDKAASSRADAVVLDLEDAVGLAEKESARHVVANWLNEGGAAWVRVNGTGSRWHDDDVKTLAHCRGLLGVMVPKAESPRALSGIAARLPSGTGLVALVETAKGVRDAADIASCPEVDRLAFGSIDFALDMGGDESDEALLLARSALVLASRAAGLVGPVDGVTTETVDTGAVTRSADHARGLGFAGKLCIHPTQVVPVNAAFAPSAADIQWASRVLESSDQATNGDAFAMDGKMVDKPVLDRARWIIVRANRAGQRERSRAGELA